MDDHAARPCPLEASLPDPAVIVRRQLGMLAILYPAFRFATEPFGRKGTRWVAERRDRTASGLRVVITDNLWELHAALCRDQARHAR